MSYVVGGSTVVTRGEWGARAPLSRARFDPDLTTAHWEGPSMGFPWDHGACYSLVRGIQNFHMGPSRGWSDIAYNAVVCGHGVIFEGRWLGYKSGANGTNTGNARGYAVCYLGGVGDEFTPEAKRAMYDVITYFGEHGGAPQAPNGHRDWKPTQCPGDDIYHWVHNDMPFSGGHTPVPPVVEDPGVRPVLRYGSRGEAVKHVQRVAANFYPALQGGDDGIFGRNTLDGVKEMQAALGLRADGIVGPNTWAAMDAWVASVFSGNAPNPAPSSVEIPLPSWWQGRNLSLKSPYMEGSDVGWAQHRLWLHGFGGKGIANASGEGDEVFGPAVKRSVIAFQQYVHDNLDASVDVDGIIGEQTARYLGG